MAYGEMKVSKKVDNTENIIKKKYSSTSTLFGLLKMDGSRIPRT